MFDECAKPSRSVGLVIWSPSSSRIVWASRMSRLPTLTVGPGTDTRVLSVALPISSSAIVVASLNVEPGVMRVRIAWLMAS